MSATLSVALACSVGAISWAFAFAIYHVTKLVEKVSKLGASNSVLEYRSLMREQSSPMQANIPPPADGNSDGTLSGDEAYAAVRKLME